MFPNILYLCLFNDFKSVQNVRKQLNPSLPGTEGGRNPNEQFFVKILFVLPLCILLFICYRSFLKVSASKLCDNLLNMDPLMLLNIITEYNLFMMLQTNNNSVFRCSICDHAKRIYYNYKSGSGHSVYSGLNVNSSISNSNHQVSNIILVSRLNHQVLDFIPSRNHTIFLEILGRNFHWIYIPNF